MNVTDLFVEDDSQPLHHADIRSGWWSVPQRRLQREGYWLRGGHRDVVGEGNLVQTIIEGVSGFKLLTFGTVDHIRYHAKQLHQAEVRGSRMRRDHFHGHERLHHERATGTVLCMGRRNPHRTDCRELVERIQLHVLQQGRLNMTNTRRVDSILHH